MDDMKLRIRRDVLLKDFNTHELSLRAERSYSTASQYVRGATQRIDLDVLLSMLIDGLGLTPEEVLDMRFGDLFEIWRPMDTK